MDDDLLLAVSKYVREVQHAVYVRVQQQQKGELWNGIERRAEPRDRIPAKPDDDNVIIRSR